MSYNIQIVLAISGFSDDSRLIAEKIGIEAHQIAYQGERDRLRVIPRENFVSYQSEASDWDAGLAEHWTNFYDRFRGKEAILSDLSSRASITITIVIDHRGRFPSLYLTHEMLAFASLSGADIDIDVYEEVSQGT